MNEQKRFSMNKKRISMNERTKTIIIQLNDG